ncbi:hypothetical protein CBL_05107 [Carabus blaptoides fortunei]
MSRETALEQELEIRLSRNVQLQKQDAEIHALVVEEHRLKIEEQQHNIQTDAVIIPNNINYSNAPDENILNPVLHSNAKNFSAEDINNAEFLYLDDDLAVAAKHKGECNNKEINSDKIDSEENVINADYPKDNLIIAAANDKCANINEKDNYLSQDSDNDNNSSSNKPENNVNVPEDSTRQEKKRSKRQHVIENTWNVKKQKINREKGVGYQGKTKVDGKYSYNTNKSERKVKSRCKCSLNKKKNNKDRQNIFSKFWNKSWAEKKVYVKLLTKANPIATARDRKDDTVTRRGCSFKYFSTKKL